jgi:hypothetical protein
VSAYSLGPLTVGVTNAATPPQSTPVYDSGQTADLLTTYAFTCDGTAVGYQGSAGHFNALWYGPTNTLLRTDPGPQINWGAGVPVTLSGTAPAGASRLLLVLGVSFDQSGPYVTSSCTCTIEGSFDGGNVLVTVTGQLDTLTTCCAEQSALLELILASVRTTYSTT